MINARGHINQDYDEIDIFLQFTKVKNVGVGVDDSAHIRIVGEHMN